MDDNSFKKKHKLPACTFNPVEFLIPQPERYETLRKIKQESLDLYGEDLWSECVKRKVCLTKECQGRPLAVTPTSIPLIAKLAEVNKVVNNELFISTCNGCPIIKSCSRTCPTVNDYNNRNGSIEPKIVYNDQITEAATEGLDNLEDGSNSLLGGLIVPWDCLSDLKVKVVKTYLYEQRDFRYIADKFNLNNEARSKYEFYSALNRLSEFSIFRKFISERSTELTDNQLNTLTKVYLENKNLTQVATEMQITTQGVSNLISRVISTFGIRYSKFVYKRGDKVVYNVPRILK